MRKFLLLLLATSACRGQSSSNTSSTSTPVAESPASVELRLTINTKLFAKGAKLSMVILNQDNIAAEARNRKKYQNCVSVLDSATAKSTTNCPAGLKYEPEAVLSERRSVLVDNIESTWVLVTPHLQSGGSFEFTISGPSPDGCNNTSASASGTVKGDILEFKTLAWVRTEMGCGTVE